MIQEITIENRTKNWRGEEVVTLNTYIQIDGVVTARVNSSDSRPGIGRLPILTIDMGDQTVTVVTFNGGLYPDMYPVQVGDRVRVLAGTDVSDTGYSANTIERL